MIVAGILAPAIAHSQIPVYWASRYNGPPDNIDEAYAITTDAASNAYVTGSSMNSSGNLDITTIKYSPTGQVLWARNFDGTGADNDQGQEIAIDAAGNVYVVGFTTSTGAGTDMVALKYDAAGAFQWAGIYNGTFNGYDQGHDIQVDGSGNVYITGYVTTNNFTYDIATVKFNSAGVQQWAQTYSGPGGFNDEGKGIALDGSGNVYVTGPSDTMVSSQPNADVVLLKYNNAGVQQWRRVYNSAGNGYEYSKKVKVDRAGNIVVMGYGSQPSNGNDFLVLKYTPAGSQQWVRYYNYGNMTFEEAHGLALDTADAVIVTGQGVSGSTNDYVTVKWDASGTQQWAQRYNGPAGEDRAYAVAVDDSLCIYVTGFSNGTGVGKDYATVKYDQAGNQKWVVRYNNTAANLDDISNAISARNGDVWITGSSENLSSPDYFTIRYSYAAVGFNELEGHPLHLSLYPNPSSDQVNILAEGAAQDLAGKIRVSVKDMTGRTVLETELGQVTEHVASLNIRGLSAGVFLVSLTNTDGAVLGQSRLVIQ